MRGPAGQTTRDAGRDTDATVTSDIGLARNRSWNEGELVAGTLVNGRYRVERRLGEGGMATVYLVHDRLANDRLVAMKMLRSLDVRPQHLDLFKVEFRTMTALRHPNLAEVYDFEPLHGSDDYAFTMEYVAGRQLYDATEDASWHDILGHVVQLCRALSYLHSRGLVHFDVKPSNVLVGDAGLVKLLDLGIAGPRAGMRSGLVRGTPAYMAPEVGGGQADHRADLYSLGITLFDLLCRRLPFECNGWLELRAAHARDPIVFSERERTRLPEWLRGIVEKLCAKDPADRFRSANAFIDAVNRGGGQTYELETRETKASYVFASRFVGRQNELSRIQSFMRARMNRDASQPAALLVGGPAGIGKSRLLREARYHAQLSRMTFLEANCYEAAHGEFEPIAILLRQLVALAETANTERLVTQFGAELSKIVPELASRVPPSQRLHNRDAERLRLFEQVTEFMVAMADVVPYALYLNDLQWAGPATAELSGYLIRRVAQNPDRVAILGAFRDDEVERTPWGEALRDLEARAGAIERVSLVPLTAEAVPTLLCSMLGVETLPPVFLNRLIAETAGVPFFLEQVMRSLVDGGVVGIEDGQGSVVGDSSALEVPRTVQDVFRRRLAQLDPNARALLDVMAVLARPVPLDLLTDTTGLNSTDLVNALAILEQRHMVVRSSDEDTARRIGHDRMRETLYADLPEDRRLRLHLRVLDALEHVGTAANELAHHAFSGGDAIRLRRHGGEAAHAAAKALAHDSAAHWLERVLEATPLTDRDERRQLLDRLADAYERTGRYSQAEAIYDELLPAAADAFGKAQLHRKLAGVRHQRGELEACADECWVALELLGEHRPRTRSGEALALAWGLWVHVVGRALPWLPRVVRSEARLQRVREICRLDHLVSAAYFFFAPEHFGVVSIRLSNAAERAGTPEELEIGYRSLCIIYNTLTLYRSALSYLDRWRSVARRAAHDYGLAAADVYESVIRFAAGEWSSSAAVMDRARAVLMRGGDMFELGLGESHRVLSITATGDYRGAVATVNEVLGFIDRMGASQGVAKFLAIHRGMATALLGSTETGTREVSLTLETARRQRDVLVVLYGLVYLGRIQLLAGDFDGAIRNLEELRALQRRHPMPRQYFLDALMYLVEARSARLGALAGAQRRRELTKLRREAGELDRLARRRPGYHASAHLTLGRAAAATGKTHRAHLHFTTGLEIAQRLGAEQVAAEIHLEAGRLAKAMGDKAASAAHLEAALVSSRDRGIEPFVRRIEVAMRST